jgi:NAD(P)-dependent dehydrogenase (short-subunit alcohol dehydrogenase family)
MTALAGKRALVVGGGSGIGQAVVEAFGAEGASIAVLELDPAKCADLERDRPGLVVTSGDATSWSDTRDAVDAAVDAFGGLDVLVNCVGLFDFYRGLGELSADELDAAFDEAFHVNVKSHLVSVHVARPHLVAARGSVVLTVSTSGFYPGRGGILYVASKFALRGAVVALAHELAPEVRVNGVAPGGTLGTDLRGLSGLGLDDRRLDNTPDRAADLRRRTPLDVALTAADHAASYVFLASDAARGMTGRFLHPDGGVGIRP